VKLIVGLGNPGKQYENTRHNVGFAVVDNFMHVHQVVNSDFDIISDTSDWERFKEVGEIIKTALDGCDVILLKPLTFMNNSGEAVRAVASFYKIKPIDILVIHDDLDIPLGISHLQFCCGPKIHNGVLSVEEKLGTTGFWRLRVGIDNRGRRTEDGGRISEDGKQKGELYVLEEFTSGEQQILKKITPQLAAKAEGWLRDLAS